MLAGFRAPKGECVDADNDVFITDSKLSEIFEYQHGAKKPVNILTDNGYRPYGCSIDFTTGNLAVANDRAIPGVREASPSIKARSASLRFTRR